MSFDLEKFKKELEYICFGIDFFGGNYHVFALTPFINLCFENYKIDIFDIQKHKTFFDAKKRSYFITTNEHNVFDIRKFIKTFDVDIKNTNIKELIKNIYDLDFQDESNIIRSIENLNLEFF